MAKRIVLIVLCVISLATSEGAWAQAHDSKTTGALGAPRQQVATIIFSGLAGAILGLSTLSFYGRPQDRLANIGVGAAVGVITGAIYTTYQAASKPRKNEGEDLGLQERNPMPQVPVWNVVHYEWTF
jgi:hypothetical protein